MSEIKVNTINPSAGNTVNFGISTNLLVLGNTGGNASLMVSSATSESLPSSYFQIYTTNGTVRSTYGYKAPNLSFLGSNFGNTDVAGTYSSSPFSLMSDNNAKILLESGQGALGRGPTVVIGATGGLVSPYGIMLGGGTLFPNAKAAGGTLERVLGTVNLGGTGGDPKNIQKFDIVIPSGAIPSNQGDWLALEVSITSSYNWRSAWGVYKKYFSLALYNPNPTNYNNVDKSRVVEAIGPISSQIKVGEPYWDATSSSWRIPVESLTSHLNSFSVHLKGFALSDFVTRGLRAAYLSGPTNVHLNSAYHPVKTQDFPYYHSKLGVGITGWFDGATGNGVSVGDGGGTNYPTLLVVGGSEFGSGGVTGGGGIEVRGTVRSSIRLTDTNTAHPLPFITQIGAADNGSTSNLIIDVDTQNTGSGNVSGTGSSREASNFIMNIRSREVFRVDATGNVGIGVINSPITQRFVVSSNIPGTTGPLNQGNPLNLTDPNVIATIRGTSSLDFGGFSNGTNWVQSHASTNYAVPYNLTLQPGGGNVVIGGGNEGLGLNTSDVHKLTVNGNLNITGGYLRLSTFSADPADAAAGAIYFATENTVVGAPYTDAVVIKYLSDQWAEAPPSSSVDGLVIEKTDYNHQMPDGGIAFSRRSLTGNSRVYYDLLIYQGKVGVGTTQGSTLDKFQVNTDYSPRGEGVYGNNNLLYNGSFANGNTAGWQGYHYNGAQGASGGAMAFASATGPRGVQEIVAVLQDGGGLFQTRKLTPGAVYTMSAKMRVGTLGGTGDASHGRITIGIPSSSTSIADVNFDLNAYDTPDGQTTNDTYKWVYCSHTFRVPNAAGTPNQTLSDILCGVRSAGYTHLIQAIDFNLCKGGIANECTPISKAENSKDIAIGTAPFPLPQGDAPIFGVRAWAKFTMTGGSATAAWPNNVVSFTGGNVLRVEYEPTAESPAQHAYRIFFRTPLPPGYAASGIANEWPGPAGGPNFSAGQFSGMFHGGVVPYGGSTGSLTGSFRFQIMNPDANNVTIPQEVNLMFVG